MRELLGRVAALDAVASESLKVIVYFDTLVEQHSSLEGIVRAAAAFANAPAGFVDPSRKLCLRVDAGGGKMDLGPRIADPAAQWPNMAIASDYPAVVWIERKDALHESDSLVLERMATAIRITLERMSGGLLSGVAAVESLLDARADADLRKRSATLLGLQLSARARVIAKPPGPRNAPHPKLSATIETAVGPVWARIEPIPSNRVSETGDGGRLGIGVTTAITNLPESWSTALAGLRFTSPLDPEIDATQLGPLIALAEVYSGDRLPTGGDAFMRIATEPWALRSIRALLRTDSIRSAAREYDIHHSTMQARCDQLSDALGYQVTTPDGRFRLGVEYRIYWLTTNRFDYESADRLPV